MAAKFGTIDWVCVGLIVGVSILIAVIQAVLSRRKRNTNEFLIGSREMHWIPVAISMFASVQSSILILGFPADSYVHGFNFWSNIGGHVIASLITLFVIVPWLFPLQSVSMYYYFRKRLGSYTAQVLASLVGMVYQLIYAGVCILGPATALEALTGFEAWKSIIVIGAVSTLPTALAGIKGVIWMDLFQAIVMVSLMLTVLVLGSQRAGGINKAWEVYLERHDSVDLTGTNSWSFWPALVAGITGWFGHFGMSQPGYQRYVSMTSLRRARGVVGLSIGCLVCGFVISGMNGIALAGYLREEACTTELHKAKSPNHLMPLYLTELLTQEGVPGLFIAALFCGGFSSITSSLSAIAANFWEDILSRKLGDKPDKVKDAILRVIVVVGGILATGLAYGMAFTSGSLLSLILAMINAVLLPLVGVFLLAGAFRVTNRVGVITGLGIGLAFNLWMAIGSYVHVKRRPFNLPGNFTCPAPFNNSTVTATTTAAFNGTTSYLATTIPALPEADDIFPLYTVPSQWYGLIGFTISFTIGLVVSLISSLICRRFSDENVLDSLLIQCCGFRCKKTEQQDDKSYTYDDNEGFEHVE